MINIFKNRKQIFFIFLLLSFIISLSFLQNVSAIGIGPAKVFVEYAPGFTSKIDFIAINNQDQQAVLQVYSKSEYIVCSSDKITAGPNSRTGFSCTMSLPNSMEPGLYDLRVGVSETVAKTEGTINVLTASESRILVSVPYPDFYIAMDVNANNIKTGEDVEINVKTKNWGKENVTLSLNVDILSADGTKVGSVETNEKTIVSLKEDTLTAKWNANVAFGKYTARASYVKNGKEFNASTNFLVGDLLINIINLSSSINAGEIGYFDIAIQNMWPETIDANVSVESLSLNNKSLGLKNSQVTLNGWETKSVRIFWDTPITDAGNYKANVTIKYSGKESNSLFDFKVIAKEPVKKSNNILMIIIIFVISALVVVIVLGLLFKIIKFMKKTGRRKK